MNKYTFIIPVYNVEKYLEKCLNSILSQTYKNFEIILVNDGSTDNSNIICDKFKTNNKNITVLHQKNKGAASARNLGIKNTNTEYIIFVDSDDFFYENDALKQFDQIVTKEHPDILCFNSYLFNEADNKYKPERTDYSKCVNSTSFESSFMYQINNDLFTISPWAKIFKTKFITNNKLLFIDGLKAEDIEWGFRIINSSPKYCFSNIRAYVYRERQGSCTHTIDKKHIVDYLWIIEKYANFNFNPKIKDYALSYLAYQYILILAHLSKANIPYKNKHINKLKDLSWLLKYKEHPRVKKISLIYSIFGFKITSKILESYLKYKHN